MRTRPILALAFALLAFAPAAPAAAQAVTEVRVERMRPRREKHETLRFLKENRDFIRAQFDLLRETLQAGRGTAGEIDPRFLDYPRLLAQVRAAQDSVALAADARDRQELLASVAQLGRLEDRLDQMERLLADQQTRLAVLHRDFSGIQRTELIVVVAGYPGQTEVAEIAITLESGTTLDVPLSHDQREALQRGGVVQVFHGLVEPREQVIEVKLDGNPWPAGDRGYITLDPVRDRLTFLKLDLSRVRPERGTASIEAGTWLHDESLPPGDG